MPDEYFEGDEGWAVYRVSRDPLKIYYLEWSKKRWRQDDSLAKVVTRVGGEQEIEDITPERAREIITARYNVSMAEALVPL